MQGSGNERFTICPDSDLLQCRKETHWWYKTRLYCGKSHLGARWSNSMNVWSRLCNVPWRIPYFRGQHSSIYVLSYYSVSFATWKWQNTKGVGNPWHVYQTQGHFVQHILSPSNWGQRLKCWDSPWGQWCGRILRRNEWMERQTKIWETEEE